MKRAARVLLAERQSAIKNILLRELRKSDKIEIVESIQTKVSLLNYLHKHHLSINILLLDASLDVEENFTLTRHISKKFSKVKMIATIDAMDTLYIRRMIQFGIKGIILKEADIATISKGIEQVLNGNTFFDDSIVNFNKAQETKHQIEDNIEDDILDSLEQEVLKLVVNQFSGIEISSELELELKEVNKAIDKITEKTNAVNSIRLHKYALRRNLF